MSRVKNFDEILLWKIFHFEKTNFNSTRSKRARARFFSFSFSFSSARRITQRQNETRVCSLVGKSQRGMFADRSTGRKENRFFFGKRDWHPFAETNSDVHVSIDKQRRAIRTTGSEKEPLTRENFVGNRDTPRAPRLLRSSKLLFLSLDGRSFGKLLHSVEQRSLYSPVNVSSLQLNLFSRASSHRWVV